MITTSPRAGTDTLTVSAADDTEQARLETAPAEPEGQLGVTADPELAALEVVDPADADDVELAALLSADELTVADLLDPGVCTVQEAP